MTYKGYRIEALGTYPMYKVMAVGTGQIPVALYGTYTTVPQAQQAINGYLASLIKSKKVKHDEKEVETNSQ